jgi:hypothetical protein
VSRGGEGGVHGPCVRTWVSRGRRDLGRAQESSVNFDLNQIFKHTIFDSIKNWLYLDQQNSNKI